MKQRRWLNKQWWRSCVRASLALAGITYAAASCGTAAYGVPIPTEPGDPTVMITDFSYEPASPVALGSGIVFTATQSKPAPQYAMHSVFATIGDAGRPVPGYAGGVITIPMRDDGYEYDEVAHDLVYTGALEWRTDYGVAEGLPVIAKLTWWDDTPDVMITGEPLTVVEENKS